MKKTTITIQKEGNNSTSLSICRMETNKKSIEIFPILTGNVDKLLISITHRNLNTLLDLTGLKNFEAWYFDCDLKFIGKSWIFSNSEGSFFIQTQARHILLLETNNDDDSLLDLKKSKCEGICLSEKQ